MGTYSSLNLGKLEIAWSKNENFISHNSLFQKCDLKSRLVDGAEDEGREEWYEKPLGLVKDRIELLGYTLERARFEFDNPSPFAENEHLPLTFDEVLSVLKSVDVSKVATGFSENPQPGKFAPQHIQDQILSNRDLRFESNHWDLNALLENFSPYSALRVLAESQHNINLSVTWDFDELVRNGWVERGRVFHGSSRKYLLVTEGTSDTKILRKSIDILRPHINDLFYFVDMQEGYPFTGTGSLYNFVKGLCSIEIQNDVVVIFDNDVGGVSMMNRCKSLNLPNNMRIMKLPDLPEFERFRTVGPTGEQLADINSKAASIECYLDLGEAPLVRWTNYRDSEKLYQGSLNRKDKYKKEFLKYQTKDINYDYYKLERILDLIVSECTSICSD